MIQYFLHNFINILEIYGKTADNFYKKQTFLIFGNIYCSGNMVFQVHIVDMNYVEINCLCPVIFTE